jgi:hypothetical protein
MTRRIRRLIRELHLPYIELKAEPTRGGHVRLNLPNGCTIYAGSTPSDWRAIYNLRASIKRALQGRHP